MSRKNERYTCLSVILLNSIINADKKYYPSVFKRMQICRKKEKDNEHN